MLVMVSNATGIEVGLLYARFPGRIGHLYSPKGERGPWIEIPYGLDNGVFGAHDRGVEWNEAEWHRLLAWAAMSGIMPLWAVVRDAIGNREATIAYWKQYAPVVRARGFRPAFVAQDGMTFADVPDSECVVFLGGSPKTNWKDEAIGPWCARFPGRVHVGRVNGWDRLIRCHRAGAISVDGTGWFHKNNSKNQSQFNDLNKYLRETSAERSAA